MMQILESMVQMFESMLQMMESMVLMLQGEGTNVGNGLSHRTIGVDH